MKRRLTLSYMIASLFLTACTGQKFPLADCTRLIVTDGGQQIIGVEDMVYDDRDHQLYLSAYDRRAHANNTSKDAIIKGGIYQLSLNQDSLARNLTPDTSITAQALVNNIRPHGLNFTRKDDQIWIDYIERLGSAEHKRPVIKTLSWSAKDIAPPYLILPLPILISKGSSLCAANALAVDRNTIQGQSNKAAKQELQTIWVTQDHASCTAQTQRRENILSPNKASIARINPDQSVEYKFIDGLSFANGIAYNPENDQLYAAQTRKKSLSIIDSQDGRVLKIVKLPGGPDNIRLNKDMISVALIPNLLRFLRFQKNTKARIDSRFALINPDNLEMMVYDVPSDILSGATIAIKAGSHIWLGGAYDTAIARCELPKDINPEKKAQ